MIRLVCFLGNPGREYERTRHNAGFMVADALPQKPDWQKKFKGEYAQVFEGARKLILLKPQTFMNLSGESLRSCMDFFSVKTDEVLVVHDELERPFGTVETKRGGGLGGHNGLRSVAQHLGGPDFARLRIGIGRPERGSVSSWVLSRFSPEEEAELPDLMEKAARLVLGA